MTDKTMTLEPCPFCGNTDDFEGSPWPTGREVQPRSWVVRCGNPNCGAEVCGHTPEEAAGMWNTRHLSQPAERGEAVEFEYPEFHAQGMGCGIEDRGITDRYEAMRYGFDEALEQMARILESIGPLYTAAPPAAGVPDGMTLVPLEPTDEMLNAINAHGELVGRDDLRDYYKAMLSAAPEATPSPTIDVAAVRQVISDLREWDGRYYGLHELADKLARSIGDAK